MTPKTRIALNICATYSQSLVSVGLGLFTSRWVLHALGETDFGIFSLIGVLITFVVLISNVMGTSVTRHLAYAIGQSEHLPYIKQKNYISEWFNVAIFTHLFLAGILSLTGLFIGHWYIYNHLNIPPEKIPACIWAFRFALASAFVSIACSPFNAMYTARQYIFVRNFFYIFLSVFLAIEAFLLSLFQSDRLFWHALIVSSINTAAPIGLGCLAVLQFPECRIHITKIFDRSKFFELFSFGAFSLFGLVGNMMRNQGVSITLNKISGPTANAAFGIANQVSHTTMTLSNGITSAIQPEITRLTANGNHENAQYLALRASFFSCAAILLIFFPICLNIHFLLSLWLESYPALSPAFCVTFLCLSLMEATTVGQGMLINSSGRIAFYQTSCGIVLMTSVMLVVAASRAGFSTASSVAIGILATDVIVASVRLFIAHRLMLCNPILWLRQVIVPMLLLSVFSFFIVYAIKSICKPSLFIIFIESALNALGLICFSLFFLTSKERTFIRSHIQGLIKFRK